PTGVAMHTAPRASRGSIPPSRLPTGRSSAPSACLCLSGHAQSSPKLAFINGLDTECPSLFQFAPRILANDHEVRRLRDSACDTTALRLNQFRCGRARKRRQGSRDDDRKTLEGTAGDNLLWLGEVHAGGGKLLHQLPRRGIGEERGHG